MNKLKHTSILLVVSIPLLMVFVDGFIGQLTGFIWGFIAWTIVLGQWDEREGNVFGIKNDDILKQHNKEAEAIERAEKAKQQNPQQVVKEVMERAEETPIKSETKQNPFLRRGGLDNFSHKSHYTKDKDKRY